MCVYTDMLYLLGSSACLKTVIMILISCFLRSGNRNDQSPWCVSLLSSLSSPGEVYGEVTNKGLTKAAELALLNPKLSLG